ncbi:MAG: hypothetical protein VCA36_00245 [Opitutales bacterium]
MKLILPTQNPIMKKIFATFLTLCLVPLYLYPEEKGKQEDKSFLDRGKKLLHEKVESGKKLLHEKVKGSKELKGQTKNWIKEDIEDIGDWEYKIVAFGDKATTDLEKDLNQLGKSRWQCFWVEATGKDKVFYFKRSKISYMHKMPAGGLLEIIGDLKEK